MKNTFRNTVSHDKLRGLLTKKVTRLLILTAVVVVLFVTPTVSFASSNLRNAHTTSVTTIHSSTQPVSTNSIFVVILRKIELVLEKRKA